MGDKQIMVDQVRAEHPQEWQLDKYAQQMLDSGKSIAASTPTITTLSGSEFLQKLSASILNSIHLQSVSRQQKDLIAATAAPTSTQMDLDIVPNHVAIDSSEFSAMDELQKQLEYDKFMNEVWIGIVFTLILISLVFCVCSCFLYHQFRTWKRNFNATVAQSQILDVESMKLNPDHEDPVPNYTLVSGLPSYEAALELLQKKPNARPIVYPSVYSVFNKHEKSCDSRADVVVSATTVEQHNQQQRPQMPVNEATRQLMAAEAAVKSLLPRESSNDSSSSIPSYAEATATDVTSFSEKSEKRTLAELKSMKNANSPATTKHAETSQKVASFEETG